MNKRYAIIRVDNTCPSGHDGCKVNLVCVQDRKRIKVTERNCKNCLYGDTKEQFTRKIETAIEIAINEYEKGNIPKGEENRKCAEIIVEFLGVEE